MVKGYNLDGVLDVEEDGDYVDYEKLEEKVKVLERENNLFKNGLTAENGAKSAMIGEFYELNNFDCPVCDSGTNIEHIFCENCNSTGECRQKINVSWSTIKDIWKKGIEVLTQPKEGD